MTDQRTDHEGSPRTYDVVVIGAGPVGENAAGRARRGGLSAVIVESRLVGGECSFYACIPSKALLRPVNLVASTRRVRGVRPSGLDPAEVLARRDYWVSSWDDAGAKTWLDGEGIDLVRGHGRLAGERRVEVEVPDGEPVVLLARYAVVLATGTSAAVPPIEGLREARPWTNVEATSARSIPERLVVLGGGVVACEMAQAFSGLGSQVTLVERADRLLGRTEPFAGDLVAAGLREAGVDVRLGTTVTKVARGSGDGGSGDAGSGDGGSGDGGSGEVTVTLSDGSTVQGDEVLAALGRHPTTDDIGLDTVGLAAGGYVGVDESMLVASVDGGWLYAVGDVNGRNLLTHMGKYQGRVCGDVIVARSKGEPDDGPSMRATSDALGAPQVVFTDPEVCAVGLTEDAAHSAGLDVKVVDVPMSSASGSGLQADGYQGQARIVVDQARRVVVGATFVGQDTAELIHSATVAVVGELPLERLWHAVPSFPTISEVWLRLLESYGL
jgi:pyruvate/2-oxoglutarate dehydrogenase complex dihydrolipoamide dehydrogenase (E3) component